MTGPGMEGCSEAAQADCGRPLSEKTAQKLLTLTVVSCCWRSAQKLIRLSIVSHYLGTSCSEAAHAG